MATPGYASLGYTPIRIRPNPPHHLSAPSPSLISMVEEIFGYENFDVIRMSTPGQYHIKNEQLQDLLACTSFGCQFEVVGVGMGEIRLGLVVEGEGGEEKIPKVEYVVENVRRMVGVKMEIDQDCHPWVFRCLTEDYNTKIKNVPFQVLQSRFRVAPFQGSRIADAKPVGGVGGEISGKLYVTLFHDSENCFLRKDWTGNPSILYDRVLRAAVDSVFPSYQFDVVEDLVVDWHWVLAFKDTVYRINERAKKVLHDRGVRFEEAKDKDGAVDTKIIMLMDRFRTNFEGLKEDRQRQTVAVLLSGDSDFGLQVNQLRQTGCKVVVIHNGKAPLGFLGHFNKKLVLEWFPLCQNCVGNSRGSGRGGGSAFRAGHHNWEGGMVGMVSAPPVAKKEKEKEEKGKGKTVPSGRVPQEDFPALASLSLSNAPRKSSGGNGMAVIAPPPQVEVGVIDFPPLPSSAPPPSGSSGGVENGVIELDFPPLPGAPAPAPSANGGGVQSGIIELEASPQHLGVGEEGVESGVIELDAGEFTLGGGSAETMGQKRGGRKFVCELKKGDRDRWMVMGVEKELSRNLGFPVHLSFDFEKNDRGHDVFLRSDQDNEREFNRYTDRTRNYLMKVEEEVFVVPGVTKQEIETNPRLTKLLKEKYKNLSVFYPTSHFDLANTMVCHFPSHLYPNHERHIRLACESVGITLNHLHSAKKVNGSMEAKVQLGFASGDYGFERCKLMSPDIATRSGGVSFSVPEPVNSVMVIFHHFLEGGKGRKRVKETPLPKWARDDESKCVQLKIPHEVAQAYFSLAKLPQKAPVPEKTGGPSSSPHPSSPDEDKSAKGRRRKRKGKGGAGGGGGGGGGGGVRGGGGGKAAEKVEEGPATVSMWLEDDVLDKFKEVLRYLGVSVERKQRQASVSQVLKGAIGDLNISVEMCDWDRIKTDALLVNCPNEGMGSKERLSHLVSNTKNPVSNHLPYAKITTTKIEVNSPLFGVIPFLNYIIHGVIPSFTSNTPESVRERELFRNALVSCLNTGDRLEVRSIGIPLLFGSGGFSWLGDIAAEIVKGIQTWQTSRKSRFVKDLVLFDCSGEGVDGFRMGLMEAEERVGAAPPKAPKHKWSYLLGVEEYEGRFLPYSYADMLKLDEAFAEGQESFFLVDENCGVAMDINFRTMTQTDAMTGEAVPIHRVKLKDPMELEDYANELDKYSRQKNAPFVLGRGGGSKENREVILSGERKGVESAKEMILKESKAAYHNVVVIIGEEKFQKKCAKIREVLSSFKFEVNFLELPPDKVRVSAKRELSEVEAQIVTCLFDV